MKFWNIERTTGDAVATANAVLLLKVDNTVLKFDDGAIGGTGAQATWIFTMQALVFAQQPHQVAVTFVFNELDQVVVIPLGGGHRLVRIVEGRLAKRMFVPFDTGHLTGFASDTGSDVDVLADLFFAPGALPGNRSGMRRNLLNLKGAWITHLKPFRFSPEIL